MKKRGLALPISRNLQGTIEGSCVTSEKTEPPTVPCETSRTGERGECFKGNFITVREKEILFYGRRSRVKGDSLCRAWFKLPGARALKEEKEVFTCRAKKPDWGVPETG